MSYNLIKFSRSILELPRYAKRIIALTSDGALCLIAFWMAFYLRIDEFIPITAILENRENIILASFISIFLALPVFWLSGLYKTIFRYSGKSAIVSISFAITFYALLYFIVISIYSIKGVPRTLGILQPLVLFFLICGSRLCVRYIFGYYILRKSSTLSIPKAIIYGAGSAGRQLVSALENSSKMKVVCFIDDNKLLHGQVLQGQEIFSPEDLSDVIPSKEVTHILLALPSINRNKRTRILKKINKYKVIVRTLPSVSDLVEGRVTTSDIRDLDIEDLLDRESVSPNLQLLNKNTNSKDVLITGAGGSIGSEICRQIIKINPKKIILIDLSEYALYLIQSELEEMTKKLKINDKLDIVPILASVQNKDLINKIINFYKPDTIYHAAAYKHVPLVEQNLFEGIRNNVFGTLNLLNSAIDNNVPNFVLISTDKAVRPTSIMGASKRLSELILQAIYHKKKDKINSIFTIVRFGNVLDSSGSVLPKFRKQISEGGPVTLTHKNVARYFMTIPEAAQLVIQSSAMSNGCDIFILDMGELIKIEDLIHKLIRLSGLSIKDQNNPEGDIEILEIGLRPGEKLYEELLLGERPQPTNHQKIKKVNDPFIIWDRLEPELNSISKNLRDNEAKELILSLKKIITGYKPSDEFLESKSNVDQNYTN